MRDTAVTPNIRLRGYWSAAAAITNGVNGKGGGAMDAMTSAHAAFPVTSEAAELPDGGDQHLPEVFHLPLMYTYRAKCPGVERCPRESTHIPS
jgi:hypothetical protein